MRVKRGDLRSDGFNGASVKLNNQKAFIRRGRPTDIHRTVFGNTDGACY